MLDASCLLVRCPCDHNSNLRRGHAHDRGPAQELHGSFERNSESPGGQAKRSETAVLPTFLEFALGCKTLVVYELFTLPQNYTVSGISLRAHYIFKPAPHISPQFFLLG